MSEIQRYRFCRTEVTKSDTGEWVDYDDAKMLLDKIAALRAEVKAWREWHNKEQEIFVEEPLLFQAAIKASRTTDALGALNEENKR